jgi:hypothetical protein
MASVQRIGVSLYNAVQRTRARAWPGSASARFSDRVEEWIATARKASGFEGPIGDVPLDGLRTLLNAYDDDSKLTPFGRMMIGQQIPGVLASRLSVLAAWERDPEVLDAPVRKPIFVLGLPRTGTTALHHVLAQDPAHQFLEFWLGAAPGPRPPRATWGDDPRFQAAAKGLRFSYALDPGLRAIHSLTPEGPEECRHLLSQSFTDDTFDSNATIPEYTEWYHRQDMRPSYAYHRDALKLIQSPQPERRWVLKYPGHMTHLEVLLETYPDACIVMTHRDPARVLPSLCSLVTRWRGLYEDDVNVAAVARWQVEMWAERIEHAMGVRERSRPERFYDVAFREIVEDPVRAIRRLYDHFEIDLSGEAERHMRTWHEENPQGKHGGHAYRAEEFGLDPGAVSERYAAYRERFDVPAEAEA